MPQVHTQVTIMIHRPNDPALFSEVAQVMVTGIEGRDLAFLGRLDADLQRAEKRCASYLTEAAKEGPDVDLLATIADAAFIAYGRLDEGAGGKFPKSILSQLDADQFAAHKWATAMRDKFVGHSVNGLNQAVAMADLVGRREEPQLLDVFVVDLRVVPPYSDIEKLAQVAAVVREKLAVLMEDARAELAKALASDVAAIVDNPPLQFDLVLNEDYDYKSGRGDLKGKFQVPARK